MSPFVLFQYIIAVVASLALGLAIVVVLAVCLGRFVGWAAPDLMKKNKDI